MVRFGEAQQQELPSELETPVKIAERRFGGSPRLQELTLQEQKRRELLRKTSSYRDVIGEIERTKSKIQQLNEKEKYLQEGIKGMQQRGLNVEGALGELEGLREARQQLQKSIPQLQTARTSVGRLLLVGREQQAQELSQEAKDFSLVGRVDEFIRSKERQFRNIAVAGRIKGRTQAKIKAVEQKFGKPISKLTVEEAKTLSPILRKQIGITITERRVPVTQPETPSSKDIPTEYQDEGFVEHGEKQPVGVITKPEEPSGLTGVISDIRRFSSEIQTRRMRDEEVKIQEEVLRLGGLGVLPFLEAGLFVKQAVTQPKETAVAVKEFGVETGQFLFGKGKSPFADIGRMAREDPRGFTARVGGELLLLKGSGKLISQIEKGAELTRAKISTKFKGVTTEVDDLTKLEKKTIKDIKTKTGKDIDIGLIPKGVERGGLPTIDPTLRGGFGFTVKEQIAFTKKRGVIVTAQEDFVKLLDKPLKRELFATPPLKETKGFVRVSRLGLKQKEATFKDILLGEDITFKKTKPQIIAFPDELVGRRGGFQAQLRGSELETVLYPPKIPKKVGDIGVTIIEGRRVPIVEAKIGVTSKQLNKILSTKSISELSQIQLKKLRAETRFDYSSYLRQTKRYVSPTKTTLPLFTFVKTTKQPTTMKQTLKSLDVSIKSPSVKSFDRAITKISQKPVSLPKGFVTFRLPTTPRGKTVGRPTKKVLSPSLLGKRVVRPPITTPLFLQPDRRRRPRKKRRKDTFKDDIALVEGFTAKILKLKPLKIPVSKLKLAIPKYQTAGIRLKPIIIPDDRRKRRKKRR
ncbi:MAG: hypothetical protein KJ718_01740 [Nanoarchaeota archaeon]|nr:hypothetical protein [Nanoarchaeota archaeon]